MKRINSTNVDISGSQIKVESPRVFLGEGNSNFMFQMVILKSVQVIFTYNKMVI